MKDKVLSSLKFDSTRILAIVYTVMVGPLLFYSFKFIPLMNRKIGLTVVLFMVQTKINTVIFSVIQRNASRKMRQFLQRGGDRENLDGSIGGEVYRYPIPMTMFMMVSWMVLSNILLFLPLYFLTSGTMTDMLIVNLLCLAASISTLLLAYFIAETTAVGFLDLDESRNLPEPSGTWKLTIGSRNVIVSFTIILSIFINFVTATMIGHAYRLSNGQNVFNLFIVGVESFLSTAILSWYFARSVARPLGSAVAALRDVASGDGDLTKRLGANTPDEVGDIARHFNTFASNLQDLIRTIGQGASTVAASSTELSTTSTEIASNTEEVSTTTHTVAASIEQATVDSLDAIIRIIEEVDSISQNIVSAVEEQSVTVNEISRNITDASSSAGEVARNVAESATGSTRCLRISPVSTLPLRKRPGMFLILPRAPVSLPNCRRISGPWRDDLKYETQRKFPVLE
ncbi:MAG: methyl-accepting chemotaxis protein [Chitinispirillaceae bacterium]|nr:methyl-accepting chemotaxis protein [Chitinispirillaceae bacterium]